MRDKDCICLTEPPQHVPSLGAVLSPTAATGVLTTSLPQDRAPTNKVTTTHGKRRVSNTYP